MLKDVGLVTNCGSWRLKEKVGSSVFVSVAFSVEVPESEASDAINDLRAEVQEAVQRWNRTCWWKMKKKERERKRERNEKARH